MLRPKGGCIEVKDKGLDVCEGKGEVVRPHSDQPLARWDIGIAFNFVEL